MIQILPVKNKRLFITAVMMIVSGFVLLGIGIYHAQPSGADATSNLPNFDAILPAGKTIEDFGGWQKLTPPNSEAFYVFVDTINGVTINVSQQLLPGKFKGDVTNKMLDLARAYKANVKLDADGTRMYIGTSAKGPQSVLFTKNGVLVLIKSWSTISDAQWIAYVKSLT
ncbi:MAG: hypothetical protein ACOH18_00300 [Candidatus Saccharimonadaceae bacterium]